MLSRPEISSQIEYVENQTRDFGRKCHRLLRRNADGRIFRIYTYTYPHTSSITTKASEEFMCSVSTIAIEILLGFSSILAVPISSMS